MVMVMMMASATKMSYGVTTAKTYDEGNSDGDRDGGDDGDGDGDGDGAGQNLYSGSGLRGDDDWRP